MLDLLLNRTHPFSAAARVFRSQLIWLLYISAALGVTGMVSLLMLRRGPSPSMIAWLIYLTGVFAILYRPRYGLYLMMFAGVAGDHYLVPWFPFIKNFSSGESILYLHYSVIFSPLETYIVLMFVSWFARGFVQRKFTLYRGPLFWPAMIFLVFVIFGLGYGILSGGNMVIALWEARPLFYLVSILILASNLLEKREHVRTLIWAAILGLFFEGIHGTLFFIHEMQGSFAGYEAVAEHTASVHMNTLFVLAITLWLYKTPANMRLSTLVILPFVLLTYLINQRRASFVALAVALFLIAIVLFIDKRKVFWVIIPPVAFIGLLYLAAFWNSVSPVGLPARSIKSSLFPHLASARDQASNIYRAIENFNTGFTVHQKPFTGVGFGNKFYVVLAMADISTFEWWEYIPHNSIIWIWLKTGLGGFIAMLYLVGSAIMVGVETFRRMPMTEIRSIALMATLYLVMHYVFAYVDISWDSQSMVYIGMMMGMLSRLPVIVSNKELLPSKRWPWQSDPQPPPGLIPLVEERRV